MKVKDILKYKGPQVFTIGKERHLDEALKVLVNNSIGVLLVINETGKIIGIISERDILKFIAKDGAELTKGFVNDIMTKDVIIVEPEDEIEYVESIITENRIRHLPVVTNHILVGLISIGDIIKSQLSNQRSENKYLRDYISGAVK